MKSSQKIFTILAIFASLYCITFIQRNDMYQSDQFSDLSVDEADELNSITIETCKGIMDISDANNSLASASQVSSSKSFISSMASANPSFGISAYLNKQKGFSAGSLPVEAIGRTAAVWLVFFVFSIIGWFCYTICCCCDNCCPPQTCCKSCRRDIKTNPYTKSQWMVPGIIAIIMSLTIIGSAGAGLVYAPTVASGLKSMQCALVNSMNNMIQNSSSFEGVQGLKYNIQQIYDGLDESFVISEGLFNPTAPQQLNSLIISDEIAIINTEFTNFNTTATQTQLSKDELIDYVNFGDETTQLIADLNKLSIPLQLILPGQQTILINAFNALLSGVKALESAGKPIAQKSFMNTISSSINQSDQLLTSVEQQAIQLYKQTKPMSAYSSQITLAVQSLFGISILAASLILIGGIILLSFRKWKARVLVHLGWCLSCIIMILGFVLGTILNPISVISVETCTYIDGYLNDQAQFNSSTIITGQMQGLMQTCIFGDGDMLNFLNISSSFDSIKNLSKYIDEFNTILNGSYNTYIQQFQSAIQLDSDLFLKLQNQTYQDQDTTGANLSKTVQATAWQPVVDSQTNLNNTSTQITSQFNSMINSINTWISSINSTIQLVTDEQQGILANAKCTIVKYQLNNIYSAFCVIFLPAVYRTTVLILIISVAMFFGSLAGCCFGLRSSKMAEQEDVLVKVDNGTSINNPDMELQAMKQYQN